jgi:hypothetical protein
MKTWWWRGKLVDEALFKYLDSKHLRGCANAGPCENIVDKNKEWEKAIGAFLDSALLDRDLIEIHSTCPCND